MFIPRPDAAHDDTECWDFLAAQGFGHLIAPGRSRDLPVVAATQYAAVDGRIVLHLARPNPIWSALEENPVALLSVAGDWTYVPGAWKTLPDETSGTGVPTTYYGAVQVSGPVDVVEQPDELLALLRTQLAVVEPDLPDPAQHISLLAGIRGVVLTPQVVRGKFKYGGNVDEAHRWAVAQRLAERSGPGDAAALRHLQRRTPPSDQWAGTTAPGGNETA